MTELAGIGARACASAHSSSRVQLRSTAGAAMTGKGWLPAVERHCERYLQASTTTPALAAKQRADIFSRAIEPTLLRELKHKGTADGDGSYTADLIGYVEVIQPPTL
jgi:hypothetical protein